MRNLIMRALLCSPMLLAASPAMAEPQAPITVMGESETIAQWTARIGRNLDDQLAYPRTFGPRNPNEGIVKVAFRCSEDGRPSEVSLYASSHHPELDQAAMRAVRDMAPISPRPDGVPAQARFQAWVVMALSEDSRKKMLASLRRPAERANAAARADATRMAQAGSTQPLVLIATR